MDGDDAYHGSGYDFTDDSQAGGQGDCRTAEGGRTDSGVVGAVGGFLTRLIYGDRTARDDDDFG